MKENSLIHVKVEYEEAIDSKKDFLKTEMCLLNIVKTVKVYQTLRTEELKTKTKLLKEIKKISSKIKKMQIDLPNIHSLDIRIHHQEKTYDLKTGYDKDIEKQLEEIQKKLSQLQGQ